MNRRLATSRFVSPWDHQTDHRKLESGCERRGSPLVKEVGLANPGGVFDQDDPGRARNRLENGGDDEIESTSLPRSGTSAGRRVVRTLETAIRRGRSRRVVVADSKFAPRAAARNPPAVRSAARALLTASPIWPARTANLRPIVCSH
jgi:hypothetical protein